MATEGWSEGAGAPEPAQGSALQHKVPLGQLLDLPSFTELCKNFVDLYRVGIKVFGERGEKLVDIKIGNGDFCGYVFSFAGGKAACVSTVARVKDGPIEPVQGARLPLAPDEAPKGALTVSCFTGCRYLIVPLDYEMESLGRVVFGPFVPDDLQGLPQSLIDAVGEGFDLGRAKELIAKIRRAPEGTVAKVLGHFAQIVETLVVAGQKIYLTSQVHIESTREAFKDLEEKNRRLEESNARLKELDRMKSSFLATVSHELRTPLTSIIGYSEMLSQGLAGPMNEEQLEYVSTIMEKGESLLGLITSILDVTQIEAGRMRLVFGPVDVNEIVKASLRLLVPQAQKKKVNLVADPVPEMPRKPSMDREKFRQCVVNLLANAVKFTGPEGEVRVSVYPKAADAGVTAAEESFAVVVRDTGIGIPQEQFGRVFETFYQVDGSSTREYGGTGLGLAIVKSFVEGHGGSVRLQSEVNKGSAFTLVFPYVPKPPAELRPPPF